MVGSPIEASPREAIRAEIVRLLTNWGKSASRGQIEAWTDNAVEDGHTPDDVRRGVAACIRGWAESNAPQGWANFARFLPRARTAPAEPPRPWFGNEHDGAWGGDWRGVPASRWLHVGGTFLAGIDAMGDSQRRSAEAFLALARRRVSPADVAAAARAHRAGRLAAFVEEWRAARPAGAPEEARGG